tara:strand:- start:36 stop:443 length:408 start_codon:yes stop_codon:yes gene_type:complete
MLKNKNMKKPLNERFQQLAGIKPIHELDEQGPRPSGPPSKDDFIIKDENLKNAARKFHSILGKPNTVGEMLDSYEKWYANNKDKGTLEPSKALAQIKDKGVGMDDPVGFDGDPKGIWVAVVVFVIVALVVIAAWE